MPAIELRSNGHEWLGTFGVLVEALAADLLSDGEPVDGVTLSYQDGNGDYQVITGELVSVEDGHLELMVVINPAGHRATRRVEIADHITAITVA